MLKQDCFNLVLVWRSLERLMAGFQMRSSLDLVFHLAQVKAIENDVVMRLCRLDEPAKEPASFRAARRSLQGMRSDEQLRAIDRDLEEYRREINEIKRVRRNREIAHRGKAPESFSPYAVQMTVILEDGDVIDRALELPSLVQRVVAIVDRLVGEPVNLAFRPRSMEPLVDLRVPSKEDEDPEADRS